MAVVCVAILKCADITAESAVHDIAHHALRAGSHVKKLHVIAGARQNAPDPVGAVRPISVHATGATPDNCCRPQNCSARENGEEKCQEARQIFDIFGVGGDGWGAHIFHGHWLDSNCDSGTGDFLETRHCGRKNLKTICALGWHRYYKSHNLKQCADSTLT